MRFYLILALCLSGFVNCESLSDNPNHHHHHHAAQPVSVTSILEESENRTPVEEAKYSSDEVPDENMEDPGHAITDRRYHSNSDTLNSRSGKTGASRDETPIMFPDYATTLRNASSVPKRRNKIPLKLLRRLSHEFDVSQVFEKYVSNVKLQEVKGQKYLVDLEGEPIEAGLGGKVIIQTVTDKPKVVRPAVRPFGGFSVNNNGLSDRNIVQSERAGGSQRISKPAICEPELKTVEVPTSDPNVILFPKCVRLDRCGGCCGSDLLTCEATRTKLTEIQVQKFAYNDETDKLEYRETEVMNLPSHTECRCNCRIKSSDCTARHEYSSEDCQCICKNRGEQEACLLQSHKLWDANLCQCICREIKPCSSNMSFNIDTCACAPHPENRSNQRELNRRRRREHYQHRRTNGQSQAYGWDARI